MKLPDFLEHAGLNVLRRKMGADRLGVLTLVADPNRLTEYELYQLAHGGIDLNSLDDLRILSDGTLALKDSRVLLYIRDVSIYRNDRSIESKSLPRFHFASCSTLRQMQSEGRFAKYVVAARQDGLFEVNIIEENRVARSSAEPLNVCQNCLTHISFNGFSPNQSKPERERRVSTFKLVDFFKQFPRALVSKDASDSSDSAPLNVYPEDFDALSRRTRSERGWRCEQCSIVLLEQSLRKFLHVHHRNGQKSDSRPENLQLLCLWCHGQEPQHAHMRAQVAYADFERIRERLLIATNSTASPRSEPVREPTNMDRYSKFAIDHGLSHQDHRARGGAFWVQISPDNQHLIPRLRQLGFSFKEGRGWWNK